MMKDQFLKKDIWTLLITVAVVFSILILLKIFDDPIIYLEEYLSDLVQ